MLHCNVVVMKVSNEKNGIFSCHSHDMNKESISITMDLMFRLKGLIINKSKDTRHKYQQLDTLHCKVFDWI